MDAQIKILLLAFSALLISGCNAGKNETNIELFQGMMDQRSLKAQDYDPDLGPANRVPPEGTVPRGFNPLMIKNPELAGQLKNPLAGKNAPEIIEHGRKYFEIYCMVCHGEGGAGNGSVAEKMAVRPPSLLNDKFKAYPDGRIYFVITAGYGLMGSYATQITDADTRWAIVNYVRNLQMSAK